MELTCGVHREKVIPGQLFFAIEFGHLRTDKIRRGVHQTGEGNRSRADAAKYMKIESALVSSVPSDKNRKLTNSQQRPSNHRRRTTHPSTNSY